MAYSTPTVSEVEDQYGPTDIPDADASNLIDQAERMDEDLFGENINFQSQRQGDKQDRVILLACHKWALREGEPESESQAGGSVSYNTVTGELQNSLTQTKWGREYLGYLRDQPNISIINRR